MCFPFLFILPSLEKFDEWVEEQFIVCIVPDLMSNDLLLKIMLRHAGVGNVLNLTTYLLH